MLKRSLLIGLSLAFLASSAEAALLSGIDGKVMVNKGHGFRKVSKTVKLKPGDRVFVRGEGSARVNYGVNCETVVGPNQTFVVPRGGECGLGEGPGTGLGDADKFVLGTFAVGGAFAIGSGGSDHDHPASP